MITHKHDFRTVGVVVARRRLKQRCLCGKRRHIPAQLCGTCSGQPANQPDSFWCRCCDGFGYVPVPVADAHARCCCCCQQRGVAPEEGCRERGESRLHVCDNPTQAEQDARDDRLAAMLATPPERTKVTDREKGGDG